MSTEYHFILTVTGTLAGGRPATSNMYGTLMSDNALRSTILTDLIAAIDARDHYMSEPTILFFSLEPNKLTGR